MAATALSACWLGKGFQVEEPDTGGATSDASADAQLHDSAPAADRALLEDGAGMTDVASAFDTAGARDATGAPDAAQLPDHASANDAAHLPDHTGTADRAPAPDRYQPGSEVLLYDGTGLQFTYDHNGFLPLIQPGDALPASNWISPVDYYNGEFQIRYVISAPADQGPGRLQTCIWTMGDADGDGRNYFPESCSGQPGFDGVGTIFNERLVPSQWWEHEGVPLDFSHPERFLIRVVLRGPSGCNVTRHNVSNPCWDQWPNYENMVFRVTIVMVGVGDTFSGWSSYP